MLFDLPTSLIVDILRSWIDVQDIALLDSACCNKAQRPGFLEMLSSPEVVIKDNGVVPAAVKGWLLWRTRRKLKSSVVSLFEGIEKATPLEQYNFVETVCGDHVTTVSVDDDALANCEALRLLCMIAMTCPSITCLNAQSYSGAGLEILLYSARNTLQAICIHQATIKTDPAINALAIPNLRTLILEDQFNFGSTLMLLRCSQQLSTVILTEVELSADCAAALESVAGRLTQLCLWNCSEIGFSALHSLARRCCKLRVLELSLPNEEDGFDATAIVAAFVQASPQLHALGLGDLVLAESMLTSVAKHCGARLRHLHIYLAPGDDAGLTALAKGCTGLESLWIDGIREAIHEPCVQLISAQRGLQCMCFSGDAVPDAFLATLADHCPILKEINLYGVTGFAAAALVHLVESCQHLRKIWILMNDPVVTEEVRRYCESVRLQALFDFEDHMPAVWIYTIR